MAVGSGAAFFGVWIIAGIATILGALLYAEMVAMMPKSGGPYAYLKAAYPPFWTFLRGWAMFFVSETAAIGAVALVFVYYSGVLIEEFTGYTLGAGEIALMAIGLIWLLTLINCFGVFLSGIFQDLFSFVKILALGAVIGAGFTFGGSLENITTTFWPETFGWFTIVAMGEAMRLAFFSYSGWEGATYVAEEVRNPRKNLPRSLFLGIGGVLLLYLAANAAYLFQLGEDMAASEQVAADAMRLALGSTGGVLISLAIMANTFGNVSSQIMVKGRTWYAMARDGLFFSALGKLNEKYKTPNRALIAQAFWATVLVAAASLARDAYSTVIAFFSFTSTIFNISTFAAVWILRRKYPDAMRPFRTPFFSGVLFIVLTIQSAFLILTLITAFWQSMLGVLLTSTGLLYYVFYVKDEAKS